MRMVISVFDDFKNKGGAQEVVLQLATALNQDAKPIVLTSTPYSEIHPDYHKREIEFQPFNLKTIYRASRQGAIFLSHHRKLTSFLVALQKLPFISINLVHIAHNTFNTLRQLSFFPKYVIAVSNGVKENLESYFRIDANRIIVIFNGIEDFQSISLPPGKKNEEIYILWPARICSVKQQLEFVHASLGKLRSNIKIFFAGDGPDLSLLQNEIKGAPQYQYIGKINTRQEISNYDYVCLFSKNEGLPLSLIEGLCAGKPLITNQLTSVLDINSKDVGFSAPDFDQMIHLLNHLPQNDSCLYKERSVAARHRYLELFQEEIMLTRYRNFLNNLFP